MCIYLYILVMHSVIHFFNKLLNKQPFERRSRDSDLESREMERDAIMARGTRQLLKEGIAETFDVTKVYVDDLCGLFATKKYD